MNTLEEIRSRYGPLIWSTVYRVLRDYTESLDCYQDVFCEILEKVRQSEVENWPAYLRWLATHRAIDRLRRRQQSKSRLDVSDISNLQTSNADPAKTAQLNELAELVRQELATLPERQAEAFWLACIEDLTYEEISQHLEIDASTVGVWIHRARQRLRKSLAVLVAGDQRAGDNRHG